jgi:hypothetical protein
LVLRPAGGRDGFRCLLESGRVFDRGMHVAVPRTGSNAVRRVRLRIINGEVALTIVVVVEIVIAVKSNGAVVPVNRDTLGRDEPAKIALPAKIQIHRLPTIPSCACMVCLVVEMGLGESVAWKSDIPFKWKRADCAPPRVFNLNRHSLE